MKTDIRKNKLEEGKIIPLTFNYMFTGIFNDENNMIIIENFLALYLRRDLKDIKGHVTIKSRDLPLESKLEKNKQVDLVLDLDGEKINIEVTNNSLSQGVIDRNVVYMCKIHRGQLEYADNNYLNIKNTIQICLNNYKSNDKEMIDSYYIMNKDNNILSDKIRIDMVDLVKARKKLYNEKEEKLAKFCRAMTYDKLDNLKEELEDVMEKDAKDRLVDEVKKYSRDDEVVALYSAYSREELERNTFYEEIRLKVEAAEAKLKKAKKEAQEEIKEAKKEAKNTKIEIAKKLIDLKLDIKDIANATGLSETEINKIYEV